MNGPRIYCAQPVQLCVSRVVVSNTGRACATLEDDERKGLSMAWLLLGHAVECAQA
jgi:hypothetical protein